MTGDEWTPESVTVGHSVSRRTFDFGFSPAAKLMLTKCIGFCDVHVRESDKPEKLIIIGRGKYAEMRNANCKLQNANCKCEIQTRWQSAKSIIG